jgi:hypothetical protein
MDESSELALLRAASTQPGVAQPEPVGLPEGTAGTAAVRTRAAQCDAATPRAGVVTGAEAVASLESPWGP